jgi:curved DNA-binding protein CbpA
MARDFYRILGVARDASVEDVKKAYKKQAVRYHPDKQNGKGDAERAAAEEKFKAVAEAVEVLGDAEKRAVYDRYGEAGLKAGFPSGGAGGFPSGGAGDFKRGRTTFSSFSGSGMDGMDATRAEAIFQELFGSGGSFAGGFGGGMSGTQHSMMDDDLFAGFMSSGMMGGGGMGRRTRQKSSRSPQRIDTLACGSTVRLCGLRQQEFNGRSATVEEYVEGKGRYVVRVADSASVLSVRPTNVRQVLTGIARVVGTSQEAINGKVPTAATFDVATRRYQCEGLKDDGSVLSIKPENLILPKECTVTIDGVQSKPALNGRVGRIRDVEYERYVVQLDESEAVRLRFGCVAAC